MPKPWMAVLAVPAVKLPQGVTGCLQLLDLQFLSTDSCTDSEEAGNSRTHQMQSRNSLDKNSYPLGNLCMDVNDCVINGIDLYTE